MFGAFEEDKSSERIRLANFMVKNFVIWKKPVLDTNLYLQKSEFFFNPDFFSKAAIRLKNLNFNKNKKRIVGIKKIKRKKIEYSTFFQTYTTYREISKFMSKQQQMR